MAQGRKAGSAAAQPSGTSEHQRPPRLPEPEERTGDRTADALLDLRDHVAASRAAMDAISAERLAEAVKGAVRADTAAVVQDLHTAAQDASEAATEAHEAAQAINRAPSRVLLWTTVLAASFALVLAGMAGWFGRAFVGPEIGLALPTCSEAPKTADSGVSYCIVNRP